MSERREESALHGESRPQAPSPEQPPGHLPGLPRLHFPEQPADQGPQPAPGYQPKGPGQHWPAGQDAAPGNGQDSGESPQGAQRGVGTEQYPPGQYPPGQHQPDQAGQGPGGPSGPPDLRSKRQPKAWGGERERPARGTPKQPQRPPARELQQRAIAGVVFSLLSLLALRIAFGNVHRGIYLVILGLLLGIGGFALGITAVRRARSTGTRRPRGAIAAGILGGCATVFGITTLILFTWLSAQLTQFSDCLSHAQTLSSQHACADQFSRSLHQKFGQSGG
ncbi:MAG TPA: hypothetical protein VGI64_20030 [Streptosporangiaceae bacterium]